MSVTRTTESAVTTVPTTFETVRQKSTLALLDRNVQRLLVNITLILLIGAFVHFETGGKFFSVRNLDALIIQISVVTILACAMTLVMVAGAIDVSVPGTVVLSGVVMGLLIVSGAPMWLAFFAAVVTGVIVGLVNSFLVINVGITSLIATIGTLYMSQGVANLLTNGLPVIGLPLSFTYIGSGFLGPVPVALPIVAFLPRVQFCGRSR